MLRVNLTGRRFGRLVVFATSKKRKAGNVYWRCRCDCGIVKAIAYNPLKCGWARSCGCLRREYISRKNFRHGLSKTNIYKIWLGMRDRCVNPNSNRFDRYGGRGIKVCRRWNNFKNFLKDMGSRPSGYSIERINNDKSYSPSNCRWATTSEQMRNYSRNVILRMGGKRQCVADWADELKVTRWMLYSRLHNGWSVKRTLTQPVRVHGKTHLCR